MDPSVKPYDDFYQFANGKWLSSTAIPADRASFAMFDAVEDHNQEVLHEILDDAAKAPHPPPPQGVQGIKAKVGAFYASGMDEKRVEEAGAKPLQEALNRIAAVKDAAGVLKEIASLHAAGVSPAFAFSAEQDPKESKRLSPVSARAASACPTATTISKTMKRRKRLATPTAPTLKRCSPCLATTPSRRPPKRG